MLGNKLGEDRGKITGQRVLDATGPKIEVSFSAVGTYAGIDFTNTGTYWCIPIAVFKFIKLRSKQERVC